MLPDEVIDLIVYHAIGVGPWDDGDELDRDSLYRACRLASYSCKTAAERAYRGGIDELAGAAVTQILKASSTTATYALLAAAESVLAQARALTFERKDWQGHQEVYEHPKWIAIVNEIFSHCSSLVELRLAPNDDPLSLAGLKLERLPRLKSISISNFRRGQLVGFDWRASPTLEEVWLHLEYEEGTLEDEWSASAVTASDGSWMLFPSTLTCLAFDNVPLVPSEMSALEGGRMQSLSKVLLKYTHIGDDSGLLDIWKGRSLKDITVSGNGLRTAGLEAMCTMGGLDQACTLDLSRNEIESVEMLEKVIGNGRLQRLDLSSNRLTDIRTSLLSGNETLRRLHLAANKLCNRLPSVATNHVLEYLNVSSNEITDPGKLGLRHNTTLQHLNLRHNPLSTLDMGLDSHPALQCLYLDNVKCPASLVAQLSRQLEGNTVLKELGLSACRMTDKGLKELAVGKILALQLLNLSGNNLSVTGAHVLVDQVVGHTSLKTVRLRDQWPIWATGQRELHRLGGGKLVFKEYEEDSSSEYESDSDVSGSE